ncbi:MAG: Sec-independent protein translocase subunit TatA [Thiothrix sp.]|nr:Sec-independent protein translocase subunit TatA [Thiothrix sp.]HPQ97424.1 Sec-independent protein translocase subunit TatA [Thiolinea sp.]
MGLSGISPWSLLIILVIVMLLFGTKRLRSMGSDLGGAFKSFRSAMKDEENSEAGQQAKKVAHDEADGQVIDAQVREKDKV